MPRNLAWPLPVPDGACNTFATRDLVAKELQAPVVVGTGMTGTGTGTGSDTKMGIRIRTRGTLTRVPAGYTHTRVHHYLGLGKFFFKILLLFTNNVL